MENKPLFGRRIGNTFPVTLNVHTAGIDGELEDYSVILTLINESNSKSICPVECTITGNKIDFKITAKMQRTLGVGQYTPVISIAEDEIDFAEADWYKSIEILSHSYQEYSRQSEDIEAGQVVLVGNIGIGGGSCVQSDCDESDPANPAYIRNKPIVEIIEEAAYIAGETLQMILGRGQLGVAILG